MKHMNNRMQYMENKMEECTDTVNDLIDGYTEQKDDSLWIKAKQTSDHLCRNNIKIHKSIQPKELHNYASTMFFNMLLDLSRIELTIDCIHRIPKPRHLEEAVPRDVLLRIHFYQAKEQMLLKVK